MLVVIKEGVFRLTTDPTSKGKLLASPYATNLINLRKSCHAASLGRMMKTADSVWPFVVVLTDRQAEQVAAFFVEEADYAPHEAAVAYGAQGGPAKLIKLIEAEITADSATSGKD